MVIKSSAARDIGRLVSELASQDDVRREAALARLAIIGARAVARLVAALAADPPAPTRAAILRALEAIGDRRGLPPALERLTDSDPRAALVAVTAVRRFLRSDDRQEAAAAFDGLATAALDATRPDPVRLAALEALEEIPGKSTKTLRERLAADPSPALRRRARGEPGDAPSFDALVARLPDDPELVRGAVQAAGAKAPLPTLGHLVDALRERETAARQLEERAAWRTARAAVHQALAERGSRLALYDLRECLAATTEPLPVGFIAALGLVGDQSCLEAIARAWARSRAGRDEWWRRHLADALRAIVRRERLTRRHRVLQRVLHRYPAVTEILSR
jgi:HEAT repeat protein